jgi:hypothetical protein
MKSIRHDGIQLGAVCSGLPDHQRNDELQHEQAAQDHLRVGDRRMLAFDSAELD